MLQEQTEKSDSQVTLIRNQMPIFVCPLLRVAESGRHFPKFRLPGTSVGSGKRRQLLDSGSHLTLQVLYYLVFLPVYLWQVRSLHFACNGRNCDVAYLPLPSDSLGQKKPFQRSSTWSWERKVCCPRVTQWLRLLSSG